MLRLKTVVFLPMIEPSLQRVFTYSNTYTIYHDKKAVATIRYCPKERSKVDDNMDLKYYRLKIGCSCEVNFINDKKEEVNMMEKFGNALKETVESNEFNVSVTENGAVGYETTGKELLDMNYQISSMRKMSEEEIQDKFTKVYFENKLLAIKFLFFVGDVREGVGERRLFRICYKCLSILNPDAAIALINLVPEYSRWDNLIYVIENETSVSNANVLMSIYDVMKRQIGEDLQGMKEGKTISLLAKWLPSISTKNPTKRQFRKSFMGYIGWSNEEYRTNLSSLRKYLGIVERKMSNGEWDKIEYEAVPSCANLMYNKAFFNHDKERREQYIDAVKNGEKKINASVLFPHSILQKYYDDSTEKRDDIEVLWKNLPDYMKGDGYSISVLDTSGSMFYNRTKDGTPIGIIAMAIAIYCAQRASGYLKDKIITFSEKPKFLTFEKCESLFDYYKALKAYSEYANTDIEAVFDLLLRAAVRNDLSQEDLPKNIIIESDMEFDECAMSHSESVHSPVLFEMIKEKWERRGYKLPRLIFWNIYSRNNTVPIKTNDLGICLVSGFSPAILKMVLSDELDPYKNLVNVLNGERYNPVEEAVRGFI